MSNAVRRVGMTVRLKPELVDEYVQHHKAVWPEVKSALREVGISSLSLFLQGDLLFMYMEYCGARPYEEAMAAYVTLPRVAEWEELMKKYKHVPEDGSAETGFSEMREIFHLA